MRYDPNAPDLHDGDEWSEMDIADLKTFDGGSLIEAAIFLCRSGTTDDVARKAEELSIVLHPRLSAVPGSRRARQTLSP